MEIAEGSESCWLGWAFGDLEGKGFHDEGRISGKGI
jgi:hypothetical protein